MFYKYLVIYPLIRINLFFFLEKAFVEAWKAMCSSGGSNKTLLIPSDNTFLLQPLVFQGPCNSPSVQVKVILKDL